MKRKNQGNPQPKIELAGKLVSASRSEMTEIVLPAQTNPLGKLLGGHVMHLVDMAGALALIWRGRWRRTGIRTAMW